ncbi:phosphodiester glycosidase family protein [Ammoniphilus resinae]|uniref:Exopolysaccharide biosynthesis protein n=1 Tax=Ammoniphilus resinae TaxID=861532 RepID=A0ABS4GJA2_9BACL|nr:phosphodiester glycosidase family protein [Ammoniphilus resinae]MBP1930347.1 exopolysaccharide biosynthesis protein [Ammoniphilus resinae]
MQQVKSNFQKATVFLLAFVMVFTTGLSAQAAGANSLQLKEEKKLAHGAVYKVFSKLIDEKQIQVNVVEVDLKNPSVQIAPIFGDSGQIGSRAKVTTMANQNQAVAAINSSFFRMNNEGGTLGMLVKDGKLLSNAAEVPGWNTFALLKDGQATVLPDILFNGQIIAPNGDPFPIKGMNKTEYFPPDSPASNYSGSLHLFTKEWGSLSRGTPTGYRDVVEMEVTDGLVSDIRINEGAQPIPENGYVLLAHGKASQFILDHFGLGDSVEIEYGYSPEAYEIEEAIGVNFLLVTDGKPIAEFPTDSALLGKNARSAIGINRNGTTLYLIAIEKTEAQPGVTLQQLADILIELGAYTGVNLDGGGSTSLAVQKPGDLGVTRVNGPAFERSVADALAVFNVAPKAEPMELMIQGPQKVLVDSEAVYTFKGYDKNYHSLDPQKVSWKIPEEFATLVNNQVKWIKGGDTQITASIDGKSVSLPVSVVGKEQIEKLEIVPEVIEVAPLQQQNLEIKIVLKDGSTIVPTSSQVTWEVEQAEMGQIKNNQFVAGDKTGSTFLTAKVAGVSAEIEVKVGYFDDIDGHWAQKNIEQMAVKGYAKGLQPRIFGPNESLTRADFIVFLSRIQGWQLGDEEKAVTFTEEMPKYALPALQYAKYHEIMMGDEKGLMNPGQSISRMEVSVILARLLEQESFDGDTASLEGLYKDANEIPEWAQSAVLLLSEKKIFGGANQQFYPRKDITRAEMATVLLRAFVRH